MVEQTDQLRRDMEMRRLAIGETVDELQNRVTPRHVAARSRYRIRTRMSRWKDRIMGQARDRDGGMRDRADEMRERAGDMTDRMRQTPSRLDEYTRGNPIAVGVIAVGAGALIASLLPETDQERRMARSMQPQMEEAASEMAQAGRDVSEDVKETAKEGVSRVKESAKSAGEDVMEDARGAGERVRGGSD